MEVNGTEAREDDSAVTLALSVAITAISTIGLLLNAYILTVIVITKQVTSKLKPITVHKYPLRVVGSRPHSHITV